jgi:hypothetical protein
MELNSTITNKFLYTNLKPKLGKSLLHPTILQTPNVAILRAPCLILLSLASIKFSSSSPNHHLLQGHPLLQIKDKNDLVHGDVIALWYQNHIWKHARLDTRTEI